MQNEPDDEFDDFDDASAGADPAEPEVNQHDELKTAMAELAGAVRSTIKPEPAPQQQGLTDDEKAEFWAVYNPEKHDPKFLQKFFRMSEDMDTEQLAEVRALFSNLQEGLVKQSVTSARNLMQVELQRLREEFAPARDYASQAAAEGTRNRFYSTYDALGEKNASGGLRYQKIIDATARQLATQTFDSEAHYFKALADGAAEAIQGVLPEFDLGAGRRRTNGTTPRLPRTSVGGTGGTSGGKQAALSVKGDATDEFLND